MSEETAQRIALALERIGMILAEFLPDEEEPTPGAPQFIQTQDGVFPVTS